MDRRHRAVALTALLLAVALGGCAGNSGPAQQNDPQRSGTTAGENRAAPEELAFTATTLTGEEFDGTRLAGRDAVLWFWAPWCPQCRAEAPHVAAAQANAGDAVIFVGVAALAPIDDMREFVRDYKLSAFDHLVDTERRVWSRFGVAAQPAYAFIDDGGDINVARGVLGRDEIAQRVEDLVAN